MRFRFAFRLLTALLALNATLASPAVALAHGEAHEHASLSDEAHEHGALVSRATNAVQQSAASVLLADDHGDHDARLHNDCLARIGSPDAASIAAASAVALEWTLSTRTLAGVPAHAAASPLGRAAPPDQPRAPPVG